MRLTIGCNSRPVMFAETARPRTPALAAFVASLHYHEGKIPTIRELSPGGWNRNAKYNHSYGLRLNATT